jgi:hypothetical protein
MIYGYAQNSKNMHVRTYVRLHIYSNRRNLYLNFSKQICLTRLKKFAIAKKLSLSQTKCCKLLQFFYLFWQKSSLSVAIQG